MSKLFECPMCQKIVWRDYRMYADRLYHPSCFRLAEARGEVPPVVAPPERRKTA